MIDFNYKKMSKKPQTKKQIRKEKRRRRKKQMKKNKNKGTKENKDENKYKDKPTAYNVLEEILNDPSEQSNQTKQQTFPSNHSEEDHNNQSTNENDNIGNKHEQKDQKEEQQNLVLKKKDVQFIGFIKLDENDKSDSLVPNPEEGMPKVTDSQYAYLDESVNDHVSERNKNPKNTCVNDKKHNVQTKKHKYYFPKKKHQQKKSNKNSIKFHHKKKPHRKFMRTLSRKNNIEPSNLIKDSIQASMKDKKNDHIVYNNINNEKNNKFLRDNSLLDPCKNSNHDEQRNTPCSKKLSITESPRGNLSSKEMEHLQEAGIVINETSNPNPNNDGIGGDNDVNKVSDDGKTNCQNINANYGIYKKECAKDMKTEDNLL